jgi:hypothetical protein
MWANFSCGHFPRVVVSDFRSLRGDIVSRSLFGASVSGGKNLVPNSVRASEVIGLQVRPYWSSKIRAPSPKNVTPPIQMASIAVSNAEPTSASRLKDTRMKTRFKRQPRGCTAVHTAPPRNNRTALTAKPPPPV